VSERELFIVPADSPFVYQTTSGKILEMIIGFKVIPDLSKQA
jgi:hypothetical protein